MSRSMQDGAVDVPGAPAVNSVTLSGRLSQDPEERTLPSGDTMWALRLVVPRVGKARLRQSVDALECVVWEGRVRRTVAGWRDGDVVEVDGALRRRFFRAGGGVASRVDVEVCAGRLIRRAGSA